MTTDRKNIRFIQLSVLCILLCCFSINNPISADQSTLERVEHLLDKVEAAEEEGGLDTEISLESLMEQMAQAEEQLIAHLHAHPNDVEALIISVRLERFQYMLEPITLTPGEEPPDPNIELAPLHTNLDRALALEPSNAEVHYWKARIYGIRNPVVRAGRIYYAPADLDQAIRYARNAVMLAPKSVLYREALALYLVEDQKPKEAIDVIQLVADKRHPIYLLLNDLESLPIPKTAIMSTQDGKSFAQQQIARGRIQDYPQLRVRFYIIPMSVAKLEKFYSGYWDGFKFFSEGDPRKAGDGEIHMFIQHLAQKHNVFLPTSTESEALGKLSDGILLSAVELRNPPVEMRRQTPAGLDLPSNIGEVFCYLIVTNLRTLK